MYIDPEEYDGYKIVRDEETGKYGILGPDNNLAVPFKMDYITEYGWNPVGEADCISYYDLCGFLRCDIGITHGLFIPVLNKLIEPQFLRITVLFMSEGDETNDDEYRVDFENLDGTYGYFDEEANMISCTYEESGFYYNKLIKAENERLLAEYLENNEI